MALTEFHMYSFWKLRCFPLQYHQKKKIVELVKPLDASRDIIFF